MLVFTRTVRKSFRIGSDVEILIAEANGVSVKHGVNAPRKSRCIEKRSISNLITH
jgi:carbon storage regulator CsrA